MTLIIGTYKALDKFTKTQKIPDGYKLSPTDMVYINKIDGWTDEECDSVVYIMEEPELKRDFIIMKD